MVLPGMPTVGSTLLCAGLSSPVVRSVPSVACGVRIVTKAMSVAYYLRVECSWVLDRRVGTKVFSRTAFSTSTSVMLLARGFTCVVLNGTPVGRGRCLSAQLE